jgi:hypothetical protein
MAGRSIHSACEIERNMRKTMGVVKHFFKFDRLKLKDDSGGNDSASFRVTGFDLFSLRETGHLLDEMTGFGWPISVSPHQTRQHWTSDENSWINRHIL